MLAGLAAVSIVVIAWLEDVPAVSGVAAISVPRLLGYSAYAVRSGSMEPLIPTGAAVLIRPAHELPQVGEIALVSEDGHLVLHRVVARSATDFQTKGDANETPDPVLLTVDDLRGTFVYFVPWLGDGGLNPSGTLLLLGGGGLLLYLLLGGAYPKRTVRTASRATALATLLILGSLSEPVAAAYTGQTANPTTKAATALLTAPTGLALITAKSPARETLSWSAVSLSGVSYAVDRCAVTPCTNPSFIQTATIAGTTYIDTAVAMGTTYSYRVRTISGTAWTSAASIVVSAKCC